MTMLHIAAAALLLLQPAAPAKKPATPPQKTPAAAVKPAATDLAVTITYKGKGTVDANHKVIAWLFTDPAISSSSRPIATLSTAKNGDTLTFKDVGSAPVYVFTAYERRRDARSRRRTGRENHVRRFGALEQVGAERSGHAAARASVTRHAARASDPPG